MITISSSFFLAVMGSAVLAQDPIEYRVAEARRDQVTAFVPEGDRFLRGEKVPADRIAGARVLESSSRGYLRVETKDGSIWVDKLDVRVDPPLPMNAGCLTSVSATVDTTTGIVRGAGGRCE
jgi:hypothetical protein